MYRPEWLLTDPSCNLKLKWMGRPVKVPRASKAETCRIVPQMIASE
jgi:hypothetical protein